MEDFIEIGVTYAPRSDSSAEAKRMTFLKPVGTDKEETIRLAAIENVARQYGGFTQHISTNSDGGGLKIILPKPVSN